MSNLVVVNQPQLLDKNIIEQFPQLLEPGAPTICYKNETVKDKNGTLHQRSTFARLVTRENGTTFLIRRSAPGHTPLGEASPIGLVFHDTTLPISSAVEIEGPSVEPLVDPETKVASTANGLPIKRIIAFKGTHKFVANKTQEIAPGFVETVQVSLQLSINEDKHLINDRRPRASAKPGGGNAARSSTSAFDSMAPETE